RRDEGGTRRLLPRGGQGPGRGDRDGEGDPGARWRSRGAPGHGVRLIRDVLSDAHRREWAFVLAATVRVTRDIDLAEECVQDAFARALTTWSTEGVPTNPGAWLTTVARNRALDLLRRESTLRRKLPLLVEDDIAPSPEELPDIRDDRL